MKKIIFVIVFLPLILFAQNAPWYTRQIYHHKLGGLQPKEDDFAILDNRNGHWVTDGWYARFEGVEGSRLVITFKNGLPRKGRLQFNVRQMNLYEDVTAKNHVIAMLTSSVEGEPDHFNSEGSWVYIRTGTDYKRPNGACGLLLDAGSNGLDSRQRTYAASNQVWDHDHSYNFQIIWDQNRLWLYLEYKLVAKVSFENPTNRFKQLWLAGDGNVPSLTEPVYKHLRIFTTDEPIHVLEKISGDAQTGSIGSTLSSPLRVQLTTDDGSPVADQPIVFEIETGGGNFDGELQRIVNTGQDGIAEIDWTLGQTIGEQQVRTEYEDMNVIFTATATAGEPSTLVQLQGNGQTVNPGVPFPQPFQVRVDDDYGNPMSGQTVNFEIIAGNGSINGQSYATVVTDVNGIASITWTPDSLKGAPNTLQARSKYNGADLQNSPAEWHYPAADINPQYSEIQASGPKLADGQDISTVIVTLRNSQNNPVGSGYKVRLSVSGNGNSLVWQNQMTNNNGQAKAFLTSTSAETKFLAATVLGPDINLAQQATVIFEPETVEPHSLVYVSGNQQTVAAGTLADPLTVRVVNPTGNPVANQQVTFTSISGGGTFAGQSMVEATSDASGLAQATPRLSTTAGKVHTFSATADTLENSPILFTLNSKAGTGRNLNIIQGNNQIGYPNSTLPNPVIVQLTDAYGNPVQNQLVTFTLENGDCYINGRQTTQLTTDADGHVSVSISLGDELTQSSVIVSTPNASTRITVNTIQNINLPDLNRSSISATSPIIPDGQAASTVIVTVLNQLSEPVESIQVEVRVSDDRASVSVPDPATDAQGRILAHISSTREGQVTVTAHLPKYNLTLKDQAAITFTYPKPRFIAKSDIHHTGVVGMPLPEPLAVQLTRGSIPVSGQAITFSVVSGDTRLEDSEQQTVSTNAEGIAALNVNLGTTAGTHQILAQSDFVPDTTIVFTLVAEPASAVSLVKWSGDEQKAGPGKILPDSLIVLVRDFYKNPVPGASVNFISPMGGVVLTPQPVYTNVGGQASAKVQLDEGKGSAYFPATLPSGTGVVFSADIIRQNTPPTVTKYEPKQSELYYHVGDYIQFKIVKIYDPDRDTMNYTWLLNDRPVGREGSLTLQVEESWHIENTVTCVIFDGTDSTTVNWRVHVNPTSVKLTSFQADYHRKTGVILSWQTMLQTETIGFNIQRSKQQRGPWQTINEQIIRISPSAEYSFIDNSPLQPGQYFYRLTALSANGTVTHHDPIQVDVSKPSDFALLNNYPNPFNPATTIPFVLPETEKVNISIYNHSGQHVITLTDQTYSPGSHKIHWDARDKHGNRIPTGMYLCSMQAGSFYKVRKLVLIK